MSPEERAKALVPEVFGEDYHVPAFRALIAQAIRDAEDAVLERAAVAIGEGMWVPENPNPLSLSSFCSAKWQGMAPDKMIETVRSLKSARPVTGFDENAPLPSDRTAEPFPLKSKGI